jgi:hypothetical protein
LFDANATGFTGKLILIIPAYIYRSQDLFLAFVLLQGLEAGHFSPFEEFPTEIGSPMTKGAAGN